MSDDRLPPHNCDAERSVIGAALRDNAAVDDIASIIGAEHFYSDAHQKVFAAVLALHNDGKAADLVTVADELQRRQQIEDIGGYPYLAELWDAAPTAANATYHAQIVKSSATFRGLIHSANVILKEAYSPTGSASDAVEMAEREIFGLAESAIGGDAADAAQVVAEVYDHIDACANANRSGGRAGSILSGFLDLDNKTGGFQPTSLVLIAARPSVGKTAIGAAIALRSVLDGNPVLFASLEQSRRELMERMMCSCAKVDSHRLREGTLSEDELRQLLAVGNEIRRAPLVIDDGGRQSVLRIAANARRMKRRRGLAAVFVDYLQLIEPEDRRAQRYEQVGGISRRLKAMAKELAVPVVAMCQLNRGSEDRAGGRPRLSDLRESGSLEMDADTVILMHRPDDEPGVIELDVAKQRNGPTGTIKLTYLPHWTRFENYMAGVPFSE